ncbi:hypothetical protein GGTG_07425 [Gaeumannomyces tritici R3-111a-1]|uniref:Transcription initiation factor TFIID subunit 10 n=1 Tax=Gaeumannomyces tritici (strain R3-111a-1) TaxID=644352 RepID=J3P1M7_GAET3|nr:hypothetical protein GGTG_07425 [Gaeumannomyces tritici R3-111a-1]EJT73569.1 hypothetical protein GGTG_07425 [Gaeumannomyces tritici R3-111a-1]
MATAQPQENPAGAEQAAPAPQANGDPQSQQPETQQQPSQQPEEEPQAAPLPEPKTATRKDIPLKDFMARMDDYAPIIPDAVTNYYMTRAGLPPPPQTDQRLARLLALATQKFGNDGKGPALGIQRPGFGGGGQGGGQNRTVLTMEDLGMAVGEYGVNVKRSEFYR